MLAGFAKGVSRLTNFSTGADPHSSLGCMEAMGAKVSLSSLRGRMHEFRGSKLLVTYHPAYLLRDPRQKKETWADLQIAMKFLGLTAAAAAQPEED